MNAVAAAGATGAWAARNAQLNRAHPNYVEDPMSWRDDLYALMLAVAGIVVVLWLNFR